MKEHERPVLLVRQRPFLVGRVLADEIHKRQAVIGIAGGLPIRPQRQPAEPPLIELGEFPVGLDALFLREPEGVPLADHLADEVVVVGFRPVRPLAVGAKVGLHLHDAHVDPHLEHVTSGAGLDEPRVDLTRAEIPVPEEGIDVAGGGHAVNPSSWSTRASLPA